jgi:hypothetical protein
VRLINISLLKFSPWFISCKYVSSVWDLLMSLEIQFFAATIISRVVM